MDAGAGAIRRWSAAHSGALLLAAAASLITDSILPAAITGFLGLAVFLARRHRYGHPAGRLGAGTWVTVARLLLTFFTAAFLWREPWWTAVAGAVVLVADGLDGALARRLGQASAYGAQLDMEVDAYFTLMLCAALVFGVGVSSWVLLPGLLRYASVAVRWARRAEEVPERRSRWGRWIFLFLILSLLVALAFHAQRWVWPLVYAAIAALALSFVPDFQATLRSARGPLTPLHRALWWPLAFASNWLLFAPAFAFQDPPRRWATFAAVSFEWLFIFGLTMWAGRSVLAKPLRLFALSWWAAFLLFLSYHHGYSFFFLREPALGEDWRLSLNLLHFLADEWSPWLTLYALGGAAAVALLIRWVWVLLGQLQQRAKELSPRALMMGSLLVLVLAAAGLSGSHARGSSHGVQLLTQYAVDNYLTSLEYVAELGSLSTADPDLRYEAFNKVRLAKRPNVYLLMIEAYGGALVTCDTRHAYESLMKTMMERLEQKGYGARTAYSRAPVHSGGSWKSIATLETGIRIDRNSTFELLERTAARLPTFSGFFREQGYQTLALQPGSTDRTGLRRYDLYRRHVNIGGPELGYTGQWYVFTGTPDQYSVGFFLDNTLPKATAPLFVSYMSVSTHYDWWVTPPFVSDWRALGDKQANLANLASLTVPWAPVAGLEEISSRPARLYFDAVQYEWRVLEQWLDRETTDGAIFFVIGDHQPRLSCPAPKSMETPLHIISKDRTFLQRFDGQGFSQGLYAPPAQDTPLVHEGFFSLAVSKLVEHGGEAPADAAKLYFPQGLGLEGLLR